jgi:hypothetical protein
MALDSRFPDFWGEALGEHFTGMAHFFAPWHRLQGRYPSNFPDETEDYPIYRHLTGFN